MNCPKCGFFYLHDLNFRNGVCKDCSHGSRDKRLLTVTEVQVLQARRLAADIAIANENLSEGA